MKVIAINGSPRKDWNTAALLKNALEGAESRGAQTELIHLYDLDYKGCISCFACKLKGGKSYGQCAVADGLKPVLKKIEEADALLLGSPIYFGQTTGAMRSFLERLMFQYLTYTAGYASLFDRKMPVGFIYTMNVDENRLQEACYEQNLKGTEMALERTFGWCEHLFVTDTYQFEDYSKYQVTVFSEADKAKRRKEVFPQDCKKAFEMGAGLAEGKD